jgi:SAM-dependent methyltransferase
MLMPPHANRLDALPAAEIVHGLLARYFDDTSAEQGASSHWRLYASRFSIERAADGTLVAAEGAGFGSASWTNWRHRIADQLTIAAHLARLPGRISLWRRYRRLVVVAQRMGQSATFDAFRQACTLELLDRHAATRTGAGPRVLVIGDGHGILSALLKDRWPDARLTLVDLGRTLLFQTLNCQRAYPALEHGIAIAGSPLPQVDFLYCPADQLAALESATFDVAINVASMQEMTAATVAQYFAFLRRRMTNDNLFYCCNRESKTLPGGEVSAFSAYPWSIGDQVLLDELCPWHQYYLALHPRMLRRYDGPHRHRLARLATETA